MNAVVDTSILIDYLNGSADAQRELDSFETIYISVISWMEILVGATNADEESEIRQFLRRFRVHPVDEKIAQRAVEIRRRDTVRLPEAIVCATAQDLGLLLVTRNTRAFPGNHPGVRIPYSV